LIIKYGDAEDYSGIIDITVSLGDWFNEDGINQITKDLQFQKVFVAESNGSLIGFLSFFCFEGEVTISWMGVVKSHQRKGVGTKLLSSLVDTCKEKSIEIINVKTLSESVEYFPYSITRSFYRKNGFHEISKSLSYCGDPEMVLLSLKIT
jgi:GNAT superfamily N-acetyltransferase